MATVRFDTRFPGYEILSELGRSNARILKARHLDTGELVAIKHFALNTDAETLRRFQRESAIMTRMAHPNIVKVREVQLEAELPFIVMELIEGGSVCDLLKAQGHLDIPTTIRLGLQMASAFKAIHPQGIVHRDIKPDNILYRHLPSGELHFLLTDFGVARLDEQSNTLTGQSLMTYEYASPEQFNNPKGVNSATDYYSLGVVLYECLTGAVPFSMDEHSGIVTFMNKVLTDAPPPLTVGGNGQSVGAFTLLLNSLLQKNAADRLNDPDELTWLLKQAELAYLEAGRAQRATAVSAAGPGSQPIEPDKAFRAEAVQVTSAAPRLEPKPRTGTRPVKIISLAAIGLLVLAGVYYFTTKKDSGSADNSFRAEAQTTHRAVPSVTDTVAARLKQQAEEARQQEQLRQEALMEVKRVRAKATSFKVGLFGGIKQLEIQLTNPTRLSFSYIVVQVNYYKESGGLYKSEKIYFNQVEPNSSPTKSAPNSDRGTRVTCKVTGYESPDIPPAADSLTASQSEIF